MSKALLYPKIKKICGSAEIAEKLVNLFEIQIYNTKSKRNNIRVLYRGDRYDSLSEAYYAYLLFDLLAKGKIKDVQRQITYPLRNIDGRMNLRYMADFVVTGLSGTEYIIDVKGWMDPAAKVKYAYFQYVYERMIHIVPTTGPHKFTTSFIE